MRYGSICSGVEAASLAWRHLGWTPAFFSEVEPFPAAVLMQRLGAMKPLRPLDPDAASDETAPFLAVPDSGNAGWRHDSEPRRFYPNKEG